MSATVRPPFPSSIGAEKAVDLLLDTIRRSIDGSKVVAMVAVNDDPNVCAIVATDRGATFERRWLGGAWTWVEVDAVPKTQLAVLRVLDEEPVALEVTRRQLLDRAQFNQQLSSAVRHMAQALLQEQEAREALAASIEGAHPFPRPMGIAHIGASHPSEIPARTFEAAAAKADAAILEFTDLLYDAVDGARARAPQAEEATSR